MKKIKSITVFWLIFITALTVQGDVIYDVDDNGYGRVTRFGNSYTHQPSNADVYRVRNNNQARAYYNFSLPTIAEGFITSATLTIDVSSVTGSPRIVLKDVLDNASTPRNIYRDIGGGSTYAAQNISGSPTQVVFNLNTTAITDILAAQGGYFAIGIKSNTNNSTFESMNAKLTLTVAPEAAEILLILAGFSLMLLIHFKSRQSGLAA